MRIRATKPDFWRSERIASVSWDARLVLKGLESYVDDNGVGKDDLALIVGDLFSRDLVREPSRTLARVSEAISELHEAGLLWRYEDDGTALLFIAFWESVQRVDKPQPGRFRRPDGTKDYKDSLIREPDKNIRESSRALAPGTGEQGNRGTEEQRNRGVPTTSDIEPRDVEPNIGQVVAAYVDGATLAGLPRPSERLRGKVGRDARRLAEKEQVPVAALIAAARSMGERGWDDIDRELQRVAANKPQGKPSTDDKVNNTLALAAR